MIEITGKHGRALVFSDRIDADTKTKIGEVLRQKAVEGSKIRIMPDVHTGKNCVVGFTMTLPAKRVIPSFIGGDIGCGMRVAFLRETEVDLSTLDKFIHANIPAGSGVREVAHRLADEIDLTALVCSQAVDLDRAYRSLGTLGGGNHFIELDKDKEGRLYLVIHSGSRRAGDDVFCYYRDKAYKEQVKKAKQSMKHTHVESDEDGFFGKSIRREKQAKLPVHFAYATAEGQTFDDYLADLAVTVRFAELNRRVIETVILDGMGLHRTDGFDAVHNTIDTERMILRKGAVSARAGEQFIVPLNMRDGALLCRGLGNPDWNFSAPHGAGRVASRTDVRHAVSLAAFQTEMQGIYTTTATNETIDESPFAYKPIERILPFLSETAEVTEHIKPVYNFKAGS